MVRPIDSHRYGSSCTLSSIGPAWVVISLISKIWPTLRSERQRLKKCKKLSHNTMQSIFSILVRTDLVWEMVKYCQVCFDPTVYCVFD